MGAWGEGMLANDSALDAIAEFKRNPNTDFVDTDDRYGVLGVAEYMIDQGIPVPEKFRVEVEAAIVDELHNTLRWVSPLFRQDALNAFQRKFRGEKVDTSHANRGLLDRAAELP